MNKIVVETVRAFVNHVIQEQTKYSIKSVKDGLVIPKTIIIEVIEEHGVYSIEKIFDDERVTHENMLVLLLIVNKCVQAHYKRTLWHSVSNGTTEAKINNFSHEWEFKAVV
jgi:hypothetical protein